MRLLELKNESISVAQTVTFLSHHNRLERVGGEQRIYSVAGKLGMVYLLNGGPEAIGIVSDGSRVSAVYFWKFFDVAKSPDSVIEIPQGDAETILQNLSDMLSRNLMEDDTEDSQEVPLTVQQSPKVIFRNPAAEQAEQKIDTNIESNMSEQYEELRAKVELVASNRSSYIKSLLITGAPSTGKTFNVISTIKEMGLVEGQDYIVVKGSITDAALYLTFIEQIDALTIFDDCDSVVESKDGRNMLKNALDTNAVRDISRPTANSINTKHMNEVEREDFVNAVSRIMRGKPEGNDLDRFDHYLPKAKGSEVKAKWSVFSLPDPDEYLASLDSDDSDSEKLTQLQNYFMRRPPNRIDFKGRIIFISNMKESEWDSAILTRAFRQDMNFSSDEMLAFIIKIKDSFHAPALTGEQKQEVLDYIGELHRAGKLHSPINFRLVQQCFDLRTCAPWKRMIAAL